jgi:hypothetical protein
MKNFETQTERSGEKDVEDGGSCRRMVKTAQGGAS